MKQIKLYIATSLDGYIARPDGNLDWLLEYPTSADGSEYGYKALMNSIDTIIMGGNTYRWLKNMEEEWPYPNKASYIVSHHSHSVDSKAINFITGNIIDAINELRQQAGKDIWLVGGGQLINLFLNHDLVDEMQICYIPIILGEGIPLFPNKYKGSKWKLINSTAYESGILKVDYKKKD